MSKTIIAEAIREATEVTNGVASKAVDHLMARVVEILKKDGKVLLPGIGTLKVAATPARTTRNPQTGAPIDVPAGHTVKFKPAPALKAAVGDGATD